MRLAYRYQDLRAMVYRDETGIRCAEPRIAAPPSCRSTVWMAHGSRDFQGGWTVDATLQRYGEQPIPGTDPASLSRRWRDGAQPSTYCSGQIRKGLGGRRCVPGDGKRPERHASQPD